MTLSDLSTDVLLDELIRRADLAAETHSAREVGLFRCCLHMARRWYSIHISKLPAPALHSSHPSPASQP